MNATIRSRASDLLKEVVSNRVTPEAAIASIQEKDILGDPEVVEAWHVLRHFIDDQDIRMRDPEYDKARRDELRAIAETLSSNAEP